HFYTRMNQWNCTYQKPASKTCLWSSISIIPDLKRWLVLCSGFAEAWAMDNDAPKPYQAGTWGPVASVAMITRDGRSWNEFE
ncbi:hypothetical protein MJN51_36430, partial [Salmonella enterica subsp. enterica serovar Kentucky]|nr:hypothetical protein [Salmonella enterica subsp. enterica serovar Kentucky]